VSIKHLKEYLFFFFFLPVFSTSFSITAFNNTIVLFLEEKQASNTLATSSISADGQTSHKETAILRSSSTSVYFFLDEIEISIYLSL
jgi:hypothetical protein